MMKPSAKLLYLRSPSHGVLHGYLKDVTSFAQNAGILFPVFLTQALVTLCGLGVEDTRFNQNLTELLRALHRTLRNDLGAPPAHNTRAVTFLLCRANGAVETLPVQAVCNPNHDASGFITAMLTEERYLPRLTVHALRPEHQRRQ
jgi:hypothetical protein